MRHLFRSLSVFLFCFPLFLGAQVLEEEPNNVLVQAQSIGINQTVTGFWQGDFEWDFYRIDLPEYGRLQAQVVNADPPPLSIAIVVEGSGSNNLGIAIAAPSPADPQTVIAKCCLAPGTYYVRLRSPSGTNNDQYTLETIFTPYEGPIDEDTYLDNETSFDANPLELGEEYSYGGMMGFDVHGVGITRDEHDWFEVELPLRSHVYIDSVSASQEYDGMCSTFELSIPGYNMFLSEGTSGQGAGVVDDDLQAECLTAGSVFISWEDGGFPGITNYCYGYEVEGRVETVPNGDDADDDESDNEIEGATLLTPDGDTEFMGYLGYRYFDGITRSDDYDWFHWTTNGPGLQRVIVDWDSDFLDLAVDFYSPDGTTLPFPQSTSIDEGFDETTISCLNAGVDIYMRVRRTGGSCGSYGIFFNQPVDGPAIPLDDNNSLAEAEPVELETLIDASLGYEEYTDTEDNLVDSKDFYQLELLDGDLRVELNGIDDVAPFYRLYITGLAADPDAPFSQTSPPFYQPDNVFEDGDDLIIEYECLGAGTYIFEINNTGAFTCDQMQLFFSMPEGAPFDEVHDNDDPIPFEGNFVEATLGHPYGYTNAGAIVVDHVDEWSYNFTGGDLFVDVISSAPIEPHLVVKVAETGAILTTYGAVTEETDYRYRWELDCVGAAELIFTVTKGNSLCSNYEINVSPGLGSEGDTEPNDTKEQAQSIEVDSDQEGLLGTIDPSDVELIDMQDWYTVDWPGGDMDVLLTSSGEDMPQVTVIAYDGESEWNLGSTTPLGEELPGTDDFTALVSYACLGEGTYYVAFSSVGVNNFSCADYTLFLQTDGWEGESDPEVADDAEDIMPGELGDNTGRLGVNSWYLEGENPVYWPDFRDTWAFEIDNTGTATVTISSEDGLFEENVAFVVFRASEDGAPLFPTETETHPETGATTYRFECYLYDEMYVDLQIPQQTQEALPCGSYTVNFAFDGEIEAQNDLEFNNSFGMPLVTNVEGSNEGQLHTEMVYNPLLMEEVSDDRDIYVFGVEQATDLLSVTVTLEGTFEPFNFEVNLYRAIENENGISDFIPMPSGLVLTPSMSFVQEFECIGAGEYYLEMRQNEVACTGYTFSLSFGDDLEDHHTSTTEEPIFVDTEELVEDYIGVYHENTVNWQDIYAFEMAPGKPFALNFNNQANSSLSYLLFYLGQSFGDGVAELANNPFDLLAPGTHEIEFGCFPPGVYALLVRANDDGVCGPYSFTLSQSSFPDDVGEFNDTPQTATPLSLGNEVESTIGTFRAPEGYDGSDYYSFELPAGEGALVEVGQAVGATGEVNPRVIQLDASAGMLESYSGNEAQSWTVPAVTFDRVLSLKISSFSICAAYTTSATFIVTEIGDFDNSGETTTVDMLDLLGNWGCTSDCAPYDLNGDGVVDVLDILALMGSID